MATLLKKRKRVPCSKNRRYQCAFVLFLFLIQAACPSASDQKLSQATEAFQQKQYKKVIALSDQILQTSPTQLDGHVLKARANVALNHISAALRDHKVLEKSSPDLAPKLMQEIIISIFKTSLQDRNYFVRSAAIKALGEMGDSNLIPIIIPSMKDPQTFVRFFTVESFGQLEGPDVLKLLMAGGQDPEGMVRVAVVKVLARMGETHQGVQINKLLETFSTDADLTVRLLAMAAMSKNGDGAAFPKIVAEIEKLPKEALASGVAALGQSKNMQAIPLLKSYLADKNDTLRMYAAEAMGVTVSPEFYAQLLAALDDKDPSVRGSSATSLGKLGNREAIPWLEKRMGDSDPMVRVSAAEGLKRLGKRELAIYQEALSNPDYGVRHFAIGSLRRVWGKEGLPLLISALEDEAPRVRTTAIRAIGEVGGAESLARLKEMMKDPDLAVRTYAAGNVGRIINKMAGKRLKTSTH